MLSDAGAGTVRLSIIIIEYHCMDNVGNCLRSVREHLDGVDYECLVLSNSQYSETELIGYGEKLDGARLIDSGANLGYAGGVNAALRETKGQYIYILNPDCLLTDNYVIRIMARMDQDEDWAIAGPKVIDENGKVQPSCRRFPRPWTFLLVRSVFARLPGASRERDRYLMSDYPREEARVVDWVSGGATIVKSSAIQQIGGMDERFFLYMEDVDWCRSAWENGFKVTYCPESRVIHAGRHQSIKGGLQALTSLHLRWHLGSLMKYFGKYRYRVLPGSDSYIECMKQVQ